MDWTEKYRPKTLDDVIGNPTPVKQLRDWAHSWVRGIPSKRAVVLNGSPGIGKTSSAIALANEMGWDYVEMNASDQRTGAEIERIAIKGSRFNTFNEDGSYGDASKGRRKLIILDEADNLFGKADKGAMPVIDLLIKTTLQPVILIANDYYALSQKSSTIRNETIQITYKKASVSSVAKALSAIASKEGVQVDSEAMNIIATNSGGDMRAAVRNLESLSLGQIHVTADMASGLSKRDKDADMFTFVNSIFHSKDVFESRRMFDTEDIDPREAVVWINDNIPVKYRDRGDLVRGFEKMSRADLYMARGSKAAIGYAKDMMTAGVATARFRDSAPGPVSFPPFLKKMSASKSIRSIRSSTVLKLADLMHTSVKRVDLDILPSIKLMVSFDHEFAQHLVESAKLEPSEIAFLMAKKSDDPVIKSMFKEIEAKELERIINLSKPKSAIVINTPVPAPKEIVEAVPEADSKPKPKQRSLFDF